MDRRQWDAIRQLHLDPRQVTEFLGPIDGILAAARAGLAHSLIAIEAGSTLIGFYVVHPDRRDGACWWLGWIAIDERYQGHGYGRIAMAHVLDLLRHREQCRRVRLWVAHENKAARHLYEREGFLDVACDAAGWHTLELTLAGPILAAEHVFGATLHAAPAKRIRRRLRLRPSPGPYAARAIGTVRGPPASVHASLAPGAAAALTRGGLPAIRNDARRGPSQLCQLRSGQPLRRSRR